MAAEPGATGKAPVFVLVHSPSAGPLTWQPAAERLRALGHEAVVPDLLGVADAAPPFWAAVVDAVNGALAGLHRDQPTVLVAHSNAGLFMPLLAAQAAHPVRTCLFVDAAIPAVTGESPMVPPEMTGFLRGQLDGDRLRPWLSWWDEADVAAMFAGAPDVPGRAAIEAELPRLPLTYFEQPVPVPDGWSAEVGCGYLVFGPPYDREADEARSRGWLVRELPGQHLHQLVDPPGTAGQLVAMARALTAMPPGSTGCYN
ncbi:MAG TPA: alpha/beta hydrolase [Streptosporangiaceae bacterium]